MATKMLWPKREKSIRERGGRSLQPKKISVPKMKHGGGRCFSASGTGTLVKGEGIMIKGGYVNILAEFLK